MLRHHFRLGNVITTVDAVNGSGQLARQVECTKQVAVADRLVLTKTDLAEAEGTDALVERLGRINPSAPLWRAAEAPLDAAALLSHDLFATAGRSEAARRWFAAELAANDSAEAPDRNRHDETIHAFALSFDGPVDWTLFGLWLTMLLNRHGDRVLRVKGILNVADTDTPVAIHGVQRLVHPPIHMSAWPDADRRSRLVFIVDGLDRGLIERSLGAFLAAASLSLCRRRSRTCSGPLVASGFGRRAATARSLGLVGQHAFDQPAVAAERLVGADRPSSGSPAVWRGFRPAPSPWRGPP